MIKCTIHRGHNQIGGSCVELQSDNTNILLDLGLSLDSNIFEIPHPNDITLEQGKELIDNSEFTDIEGIYVWDNRPNRVDAVLISHSHPDHWGIVPWIKPEIRIYFSEVSLKLINKSAELLGRPRILEERIKCFKPDRKFIIGNLECTPHLVDHSAFEASAFEVADNKHTVFYTGDFRQHGRKEKLWDKVLKKVKQPLDLLIIEGTTLSRPDEVPLTEKDLETRAVKEMSSCNGLAMIWTSSQNIDRLVTAYRSAKRTDRIFVIDPYTAHMLKIAGQSNVIPYPSKEFSDVRVYFSSRFSSYLVKQSSANALYEFKKWKITKEEIIKNPSKYFMIVRPSVKDFLNQLPLDNSVLFYSMWAGYREDEKSLRFLNWLKENGTEEIFLHTSGHADANTIRETIKKLNPHNLIPIHTTLPEWFEKEYANTKIVQNGNSITLN